MTDAGVRGEAEAGEGVCPCRERHSGRERRSGCRCIFGQQEQRLVRSMGAWVEGVKVECRWFYVCPHDDTQHNLCMCPAGTQPGVQGWDL